MLRALGPGIVWMALAQGAGELYLWPYIVAKYGLGFLFLLLPACLLQYPVNYQIAMHTVLTGESVWQALIRLHRGFAAALWLLMTISFSWLGGYVVSGSMAELTGFPPAWTLPHQKLFWGYAFVAVFLAALLLSRVMYNLIERLMLVVSLVTLLGFVAACTHPHVRATAADFFSGLFWPRWPEGRTWNGHEDATKLLTAITFAGLGGFWTLFYSYWLREKNTGMAARIGRITSPITGRPEVIPEAGYTPDDTPQSAANWRRWRRFLIVDIGVGIFGNLITTLMTCWLAYALLFPTGLTPTEAQPVEPQREFFTTSWGRFGGVMFLILATLFLADTWLTTIDAVSRVHSDVLFAYLPRLARRFSHRFWYWMFAIAATIITCVTMPLQEPGQLILSAAVIGFAGTVLFCFALLIWNHVVAPRHLPRYARPGILSFLGISFACLAYTALAVAYLVARLTT
jgi:Mn2+/Fe2+ NRAMP family transporter